MPTLSLVAPEDQQPHKPVPADPERLARVKGEIVSLLEDKLQELQTESKRVHAAMEQVQFRIGAQGFEAHLEEFTVSGWNKAATEVKLLQEVLQVFESHE